MTTRSRVSWVALVFRVVAAATPAMGATTDWRTYTNSRWGYRIDVPNDLVSQPEPENGGGLAFLSPDGQVKLYTTDRLRSTDRAPSPSRSAKPNSIGSAPTVG